MNIYVFMPVHTNSCNIFVHHKFGVSTAFNMFLQHPWHGTGQGAANATLQYIILLDTLINAYHTKVVPQMMHDPSMPITIQRRLKAFIDDIVLQATTEQPDEFAKLQQKAQQQLAWWVQVMQVTGGIPPNAVD